MPGGPLGAKVSGCELEGDRKLGMPVKAGDVLVCAHEGLNHHAGSAQLSCMSLPLPFNSSVRIHLIQEAYACVFVC